MKLSVNPIAVAAVAMLALAAPAHAQRDFDWSGAVAPGATLRVFTVNGTVTVRQSSGGTARIHAETQNASSGDEIRYVTARSGGDVRVCAVRGDATCDDNGVHSGRGTAWRNRRAKGNFTVEVPRGVVVRVSSGNGDVTVDGATADVHASSGNGDVRVGTGAAQVRVSTGNGAVMVDGARGPVNASSGNGRVAVTTSNGPVSASTGNGRIEVALASLRGAGDMSFSSGNGPVVLTLPADFSADVEASTGNGGFQSDFPLRVVGRMSSHRVSGTIGQGGRRLHISTGNGSITLRRAGT
ncbi:DUF4097 family beta strand repeat-containing protein [Longimicrobium sp.]|uniref:DUF4097 family beta strand repeat-containing protein n=1 Tax=Longimicrobium sp. TaxID=2029185 RepID=UPI002C7219A2|nr:DUF4097 family beta strand repeat-containing protein [Longimicrobium sp.]HSU14028.1 DUF4097 family beta strand repeat-containing protein [Longimicrobium sp.]